MIHLEVCTGSIQDSIIAWKAGASRLELNSGLETGGLTPSPGVVREVIGEVPVPVVVMIRPRSGDFVYSPAEKRSILRDVETFLGLGASGVVFGSLLTGGRVDREMTALVRSSASDSEVVFHRAFDLTEDLMESASILLDLGIDRILTSGGETTAWEGRHSIRELVKCFGHSLDILPGSGIRQENVLQLVRYTGCGWVHGSFSRAVSREAQHIIPSGIPGPSFRQIETVISLLNRAQ